MIVSTAGIFLDENLIVLHLPVVFEIVDLLQDFGRHRNLNNHLEASWPNFSKEAIPGLKERSTNLAQNADSSQFVEKAGQTGRTEYWSIH